MNNIITKNLYNLLFKPLLKESPEIAKLRIEKKRNLIKAYTK
jgi:hypothetical protein